MDDHKITTITPPTAKDGENFKGKLCIFNTKILQLTFEEERRDNMLGVLLFKAN